MEHNLTQGSVGSALMKFMLPFLAASILQFLYSAVDMVIVGRFADAAAISAVNTSSQIMLLVTCLVQGIATGGTVVIGRHIGGENHDGVHRTIHSMVWIFIAMAIILTAAMLAANKSLIAIADVPEAAVEPAQAYLKICSFGIVFIAGYNGISGILRGLGNSRRPMIFVAVSCILNIFGDLLLVGGFRMGAAGAAWATAGAQAVAFIMSAVTLQCSEWRLHAGSLRFDRIQGGLVIKIGLPLAAQDFLTNLSFLLITVIVNGMGLSRSAAVGVVERIIGFCMLVPIAFLSALSAFTAQNLGAGRADRALRGLRLSLMICAAISAAIVLVAEIIPGTLVGIFTEDIDVITYGIEYFRTYAIDIFMVAFVFSLNGFYSGCGRTGFTMANGLISTFALRIPLVFAVSRIPGVSLSLIGAAAPIASALQIMIQLFYFRRARNSLTNRIIE